MNLTVSAYDTEDLSEKISELNSLLSECTQMGIECPYEKMKITVMEQFAEGEAISEPDIAKARLDEIYEETKAALNQYISGTKKPMSVPAYQTSNIEIDGKNMIADTTAGRRPVFFVGYGHFDDAVNAFGEFSKLGANITQQQIGPWSVVFEAAMPYGWKGYRSGYSRNAIETNFDTTNVRGGKVSLKINTVSDTVTSGWAGLSQDLVLEPNTTYTLTFTAKGTCGTKQLYITPFTGVDTVYLSSSNVWKNYSSTFTTENVTSGIIDIAALPNCEFYIDNIKLVKVGNTENLLENGNFEKNADRFGNNNEYIIITDYIEDKIIPMLDSAATNNVAVSLLISPHYFPTFVKEYYYPDINIYHEQYIMILDKYIETLIPMIRDCPALNDICLTNEPSSNSSGIDSLQEDYRNSIIGKYDNLAGINEAWGTSYGSVEEIVMPTEPATTREFYDWMDYNDTKLANWHEHLADEVRKYMPKAKIHAKMQDYLCQDGSLEYQRGILMWGTDAEKFAEFSDIAGNDAYSNYEYKIESASGRPISGKMKWYDFISSIYEAPIFNSEDHIIPDGSTNYNEAIAAHVSADIFQGGIHGRSASALWSWLRTDDETSIYEGNVLQRPDVMAKIGKATLDLNRLAYEVAAFSNKQAEVVIYYSNLERAYNPKHLTILDRAHDACLYAGQKVEFVTDSSINEITNCDVLIIPNVNHVPSSTLQAVEEFKNSGKTVILLESCFKYDEYGNSISFDSKGCVSYKYIYSTTSKNIAEDVYNSVDNPYTLKLCDSNGKFVSGLEWNYVMHEGKVLVNLCNYNDTDLEGMKLIFEDEVMDVTDIISGENKGTAFTAKSFEPMILTFEPENYAEISQCYVSRGKVYATVNNQGDYSANVKIIAEYYDENSIKRQWGSVKREISAGSDAEVAFSFNSNGGQIIVKLLDKNGMLLDEKTFEL